jgi:hypothetical protein
MPSFEKDEETMYTFSELLLKISDGQPLSDTEREALRQHAIRVDEVSNAGKAWQSIDGKINNNFLNLPLETIYSRTLEQKIQALGVVIPPKYNTLIIVANGRTDQSTYWTGLQILLNDDNSANYNHEELNAGSNNVAAAQVFPDTSAVVGYFNGSTATAAASAGFIAFMTNIRGNMWKSIFSLSALGESSATTTALSVRTNVWKSTEPVRKVTFRDDATNNLEVGSYFGIYGIV